MRKKPLGRKAYGSIGHLPGSRLGPGDHHVNDGQARILTERTRDGHDTVIVQEKLDGSCVAVARIDCELVPLIRAGYRAESSPYEQHHLFAKWVHQNTDRFAWLPDGHRVCGEWLAQAHGTRYDLEHEPFVVFDVIHMTNRLLYHEVCEMVCDDLPTADVLSIGGPRSIEQIEDVLGRHGSHGAIDPAEGAVWRVERKGRVDFLAKYVRSGKVDGCYLPEVSGGGAVWNWHPGLESKEAKH